jgi:hypothetical protein
VTATVSRLRCGIVKGIAQEDVEALHLTEGGIREDRRFVLVDAEERALYGANLTRLAGTHAAFDEAVGLLTLRFADGEEVVGRVSETGEEMVARAYGGRPVPGRVVGGPFAGALSTRAGQPLRVLRVEPGVGAPGPLTLLGSASIARVGRELGDAGLDARRFRMSIELAGTEPYEEDGWDGGRVRVGSAVLEIRGQVPRCVLTTLDPDTLVRDRDTLRAILAHRPAMATGEAPLGVYAHVVRPARIALGDVVEPL